jgi:hypothetical protein
MPHHLARKKAKLQYDAAFHLLHVTYPLVRDPKLLKGVINNIVSSMEHGIDAVLAYERQLKLIPHYGEDFQSKFNLFRYKCVKRNKVSPDHMVLLQELREVLQLQQKCPVEFQRGNKYVLATKDYRLKTLSLQDLKAHVRQNKAFLDKIDQIIRINRKA